VVAAAGADDSDDAAELVTARRWASRSGHGTGAASRSDHALAVAAGELAQAATSGDGVAGGGSQASARLARP
jgi:hypothetical protein